MKNLRRKKSYMEKKKIYYTPAPPIGLVMSYTAYVTP